MKFKSTLETEIYIDFLDIEKSKATYLSEAYAQGMYRFDDMEDVVSFLSRTFSLTSEHWYKDYGKYGKQIEGFGNFIFEPHEHAWVMNCPICGVIKITDYEVECSGVDVEEEA